MRRTSLCLTALALLAACTGGGGPPTPSPSPISTPHRGGEAVFGAEQWPECLNPITFCASANWTHFLVLQHVLPRAMQLDQKGNFVASPLLVEAPTLENGGLTQDPFTVRYRIAPEAVWDDGSPITSEDFRFTWLAQLHTVGAYFGYEGNVYKLIKSVDTTDPRTAVITFRDLHVDWPDLFGGIYQYVLKASAFPDEDPDRPNLRRSMMRSIPFSAGPFLLESWSQREAVFVRNDRYFGTKPLLDRVTFLPVIDQELEFRDVVGGHVSAIFPQVSFGGPSVEELRSHRNVRVVAGDGVYFEALWLNHSVPPLDDPRVREALMYAIDREAVLDRVIRPTDPNAQVLNCGFVAFPGIGPWCRTRPFERFTYDPARARAILEATGYDCATTPCTKGFSRLEIVYATVSTNVRRTASQQLLIERALSAGFSLVPRNYDGGLGYFDFRDQAIADYATGGSVDPSITEMFACDEIPTREDPWDGGNKTRWCNPRAELLMHAADRALDPARRLELLERVYQLEAEDFISLPLYVLPATSVWRSDLIAGPIGAYNSSPYGMFFNMNEWYLVTR